MDLARRSGQITSIAANVHYSDDALWEYEEGTEARLRHRRGQLQGDKPPANRAPALHETKAEIAALRHDLTIRLKLIDEALRRIERSNGTLAEDHRELRRLLIDVDHEAQKLT